MKETAHSKRPEKLSAIQEIDAFVAKSNYCFILNYGTLDVAAFSALRKELAKAQSQVKVVKNTYLAKALEDKGWTGLETVLSGPTALVTGDGDPADVAKIVAGFVKKNEEKASIKGGQLDATSLDAAAVKQLAELPNKDGMRVHLLLTLLAPCKGVLYALKAKMDKEGGAPAEEAAPAAEAPAEA